MAISPMGRRFILRNIPNHTNENPNTLELGYLLFEAEEEFNAK